jgi:hypothetical protein
VVGDEVFDVFDLEDLENNQLEQEDIELPTREEFAPNQAILDGLDVPVVPDTQVDISQDVQEVKGEQKKARSALWKVCCCLTCGCGIG